MNLMLLFNYSYDLFKQDPHRKIPVCVGQCKQQFFNLIQAADLWQSEFSKICFLIWFRSVFKLLFLSHGQFDFLHRKHNWKHSTCRRVFNWKSIIVHWCISILLVHKFLEKHCVFIFSGFSDSYLAKTTSFVSSIRVVIENFLVLEDFLMGELSIGVPCISVLTVRNFQEMLLCFNSFIFQTCITQLPQVRNPPSWTQSKTKHL